MPNIGHIFPGFQSDHRREIIWNETFKSLNVHFPRATIGISHAMKKMNYLMCVRWEYLCVWLSRNIALFAFVSDIWFTSSVAPLVTTVRTAILRFIKYGLTKGILLMNESVNIDQLMIIPIVFWSNVWDSIRKINSQLSLTTEYGLYRLVHIGQDWIPDWIVDATIHCFWQLEQK